MDTNQRRFEIIKSLCKKRHDTTKNLAFEFGVSERTIYRDIEAISTDIPIYTVRGRYYGGIYVVDNFYYQNLYLNNSELNDLNDIVSALNKSKIFFSEIIKLMKKVETSSGKDRFSSLNLFFDELHKLLKKSDPMINSNLLSSLKDIVLRYTKPTVSNK